MVRCPACPDAVARIEGGADVPHLSGEVRSYQESGNVLVVADISGIPICGGTGSFALHIHEGGSYKDPLAQDPYAASRSYLLFYGIQYFTDSIDTPSDRLHGI